MEAQKKGMAFPDWAILITSVILGGSVIYYAGSLFESRMRYGIIFLSLSVVIVALMSLKRRKIYPIGRRLNYVVVGGFIACALGVMFYFYTQYPHLMWERAGNPNVVDLVFAVIALFVVLETTRGAIGPIIPALVLIFWLYAYFGYLFPGDLYHGGLRISRIIGISAAEMDGIYGSLNQVGCSWIAIFVIYAGLIQGFRGLDLVVRGGQWIARRFRYMLPQVAIFGSLLFGMFSGSAGANAAGTGAFTIPTMKEYGIPGKTAAGIEAVASSGGQIMPPIMGATAFVMCDYLGMHYIDLIGIAFIPALMAYFTVAVAVYVLTRRYITGAPQLDEAGPVSVTGAQEPLPFSQLREPNVYDAIPILGSISVLMVLLAVFKLNVLVGGFYTICAFLGMRVVFDIIVARGRPSGLVAFGKGIILGLRTGALTMALIGVTLGTMGVIIKVLVATGLAQKLAFLMVDLSGGSFFILMFLVAVVCILFGMAVSSVACYILVVTLAAPALQYFGVPLVASHFAVFYLAIVSGITPPVAGVCILTSFLAGSRFLPTCWEAIKIGISLFILPFAFMIHPEVFANDITTTPLVVGLILVGCLGIILALHMPWTGWVGAAKRVFFLAAGGLSVFAGDTIAIPCMIAVLLLGTFEVFRWLRGTAALADENIV